jgi:arginine utilization regulatory protein
MTKTMGKNKLTVEEMEERLFCLEKIIDMLPVGVNASREGEIFLYNQQMASFEGLKREDVLGSKLTKVYQVSEETSEHLQVLRSGNAIIDLYQHYYTSDGNEINLVASTYPIKKDGRVIAVFSIGRNETKIRQMLTKTVQMQEKLRSGSLANDNGTNYTFSDFIGQSEAVQKVLDEARRAAATSCSVIITGETGTGKEIIAQGIHNENAPKEPFVAINCAAIPENLLESMLFGTEKGAFTGAGRSTGLIEHAGAGTLFLDEIDSMGISLQSKLLRVLQEKKFRRLGETKEISVGCRIISSTGTDPWQCIEEGRIRKDLYFRLAVMTIFIPPLRERKEDIALLIEYFLKKYNRIYGQELKKISPGLKQSFMHYPWTGNARELAHVIESAINMAEDEQELAFGHLPVYMQGKFDRLHHPQSKLQHASLNDNLMETEQQAILESLQKNGGNITQAARDLGIARQNLQYRMKKLNIKVQKEE